MEQEPFKSLESLKPLEPSRTPEAPSSSEATRAYDAAEQRVEDLVDKSLHGYHDAWNQVDPDHSIRRAYEDEQAREQDALNRHQAEGIREEIRTRARTIIEQAYPYDEEARAHALSEQRARERASEERRQRPY